MRILQNGGTGQLLLDLMPPIFKQELCETLHRDMLGRSVSRPEQTLVKFAYKQHAELQRMKEAGLSEAALNHFGMLPSVPEALLYEILEHGPYITIGESSLKRHFTGEQLERTLRAALIAFMTRKSLEEAIRDGILEQCEQPQQRVCDDQEQQCGSTGSFFETVEDSSTEIQSIGADSQRKRKEYAISSQVIERIEQPSRTLYREEIYVVDGRKVPCLIVDSLPSTPEHLKLFNKFALSREGDRLIQITCNSPRIPVFILFPRQRQKELRNLEIKFANKEEVNRKILQMLIEIDPRKLYSTNNPHAVHGSKANSLRGGKKRIRVDTHARQAKLNFDIKQLEIGKHQQQGTRKTVLVFYGLSNTSAISYSRIRR